MVIRVLPEGIEKQCGFEGWSQAKKKMVHCGHPAFAQCGNIPLCREHAAFAVQAQHMDMYAEAPSKRKLYTSEFLALLDQREGR
jgi:hypothetical protein